MLHQALGRVRPAVQQHVLHQHLQLRFNLLVHLQHPGIHNAHVHARRDGVIKKRGVHRLAHFIVAAKAERNIRNAAAYLGMGQVGLDPARGIDVIHRIVVVLLHASGHGQDVGIEDDVFRRKSDLVHKHVVSALADADFFLVGRGLALFVKGHYHHRRAILQHRCRVPAKLLFPFLQRDRIHNALALQALQPCLNHFPFGRVHHKGDLGHLRFAGQQLQESCHGRDAVDHPLVHADVNDIGAILHLLPRHAHRFFKFSFLHQPGKLRRTGHIGPLANHDVDAGLLGKWLRSRQTERLRRRHHVHVLGHAHLPLSPCRA